MRWRPGLICSVTCCAPPPKRCCGGTTAARAAVGQGQRTMVSSSNDHGGARTPATSDTRKEIVDEHKPDISPGAIAGIAPPDPGYPAARPTHSPGRGPTAGGAQ